MRTIVALLMVVVGAGAVKVSAHHAFAAEYDVRQPLTIRGTVKKMEWINPHAWLLVESKNPDGSTQLWMIETGAPNALLKRGFNRNSVPPGAQIVINGYAAKAEFAFTDGRRRVNGSNITFADGRKLFLGSSGTGAPTDPLEKQAPK